MSQVPFSDKATRTHDQPISYFMQQAVENPHLISLAAGLVDPLSLPAKEISETITQLLSTPESAGACLQYGTTHGYRPLREKLLERTARMDGVKPAKLGLSISDVVITTGSQQLLYLIGELLINPGDIVITEAPSYFVYQGTLTSMGARILSVPMDEHGMKTELLEDLLKRLKKSGEIDRVRMIYINNYFQNPSGLNLSIKRRQHVVKLAQKYSDKNRIFILEDAAYRELRYEGEDLPSIKSFDKENQFVITAMTFSKPCAPGLKTGYGLLPSELVQPVLRLKGNHDFGSSNLAQHLLDRLIESGAYDRHVQVLCNVYRNKRDALLHALEREFKQAPLDRLDIHWTHPDGGLYVWMTFPATIDTGPNGPLMKTCLREGVLYVPGQFCYVEGECGPKPTYEARLSFGVVPIEQIDEAVHRLARAVVEVVQPAERTAVAQLSY